ncbi:uncharacterized protein LOC122309149 [Carya illinoinensis]|uniref:uncharacterized protein LOC122309149 n=1 Tax=Carya illinoinensis TaxID=32201 RepID=UPI001C71F301|nr:uncharacterized protein LOC122309149 [Carya illinoinensis]
MAHMKFVCLSLVLISCTAWLPSLAHPSQDTKAAGREVMSASVSSAKCLLEDERAATACTNKKIKGRKMQAAMGNNIVKQGQKKEHGAVAGRRTTSNISSSNQVDGKYEADHEEAGKNGSTSHVEHERQNVYRSSEQIDEAAGFVAFNADYHAPRHHPPKNN